MFIQGLKFYEKVAWLTHKDPSAKEAKSSYAECMFLLRSNENGLTDVWRIITMLASDRAS